MKVSLIKELYHVLQKQWHEAMQKSGSKVHLGNNPCLAEIIHHTWKWPFVAAGFYFKDRLIAWASAISIRNNFVSLPHFDHGSLWVDVDYLTSLTETMDQAAECHFHKLFYTRFCDLLGQGVNGQATETLLRVDLELQELKSDFFSGEGKSCTKFRIRERFRLSEYFQDGKVIPFIHTEESMLKQMDNFSGNLRRKIRKAEKNGIETIVGKSELLDDFYRVYCKNISRLGSFGLPEIFFTNLLKRYKYGEAYVVLARYKQKIIGSSIVLCYLNFAENAWFASDNTFSSLYVTYALHHKMISLSIEAGCSTYSFGRSTENSSVHTFKKQWGTTDQPLYLNDSTKQPGQIQKHTCVRHFLKRIPSPLIRPFDGLVSRYVY